MRSIDFLFVNFTNLFVLFSHLYEDDDYVILLSEKRTLVVVVVVCLPIAPLFEL